MGDKADGSEDSTLCLRSGVKVETDLAAASAASSNFSMISFISKSMQIKFI